MHVAIVNAGLSSLHLEVNSWWTRPPYQLMSPDEACISFGVATIYAMIAPCINIPHYLPRETFIDILYSQAIGRLTPD